MNRPPLILISASSDTKGVEFSDYSLSLSHAYAAAVQAAGAVPWVLPCLPERNLVAEAVRRSDGLLLTGGDDVASELYAASLPAKARQTIEKVDPPRDLFELLLIDEIFRQRKPLLAICRGHQMLNVALGGTLLADIAIQKPHALNHWRSDRKDRVVHQVECAAGSLIERIAGRSRFGVNSSHHQAVARIAQPLRASAVSTDGIVEGLELAPEAERLLPWLLSVQFHPERLFARQDEHRRIFDRFCRACLHQRQRMRRMV